MIQNKYIIRLLFLGLFIAIMTNIIFYRYFMIKQIGASEVGALNSKIAESYKAQVWINNKIGVGKLKNTMHTSLLQDSDFIKLSKDSLYFFDNIGYQISLYDMYGNKFLTNAVSKIKKAQFSSDDNFYNILWNKIDNYFLKDIIFSKTSIQKALKGETQHLILPKALVFDDVKLKREGTFIVSYIPIIDEYMVYCIMEIYTDFSDQWQNIEYLSQKVFVTFIIIFTIFFGIIIYNTHYAQKIINQQFETNRSLKEANIQVEKESSAKTEFLANVSHELRTPLNSIIGFSEMMINENYNKIQTSQYKEYIQDINNSGKHLLGVINDILDFSKASADKLKVECIELDLNKLVSSTMRFIKPRAEEAKVTLVEDMPKEHIIIKADPQRLKQALLNLLSNSVKFTPNNGTVTIKIYKDLLANLVLIEVVDTGIGMNEKDIPKAFAAFGQVDNKLNRKYEGTGLGLPLTKKLVELMQGKFALRSEINKGTIVTLTFKYDNLIEI